MAKNLIYKRNNEFFYSGDIEPYIVQKAKEVEGILTSNNAQVVLILGDGEGMSVQFRLPGGEWTEV